MSKQLIFDFVYAINLHDPEKIKVLMTDNHEFIDSHGTVVHGAERMKEGWEIYFTWFPDYKIEITEIHEDGDVYAVFGHAGGTFMGRHTENDRNRWRVPAAWRAMVEDGKILTWQVYVDTKRPFDIIERAREEINN